MTAERLALSRECLVRRLKTPGFGFGSSTKWTTIAAKPESVWQRVITCPVAHPSRKESLVGRVGGRGGTSIHWK
jgi:hypothetical protein